jgi:hypothetical protein
LSGRGPGEAAHFPTRAVALRKRKSKTRTTTRPSQFQAGRILGVGSLQCARIGSRRPEQQRLGISPPVSTTLLVVQIKRATITPTRPATFLHVVFLRASPCGCQSRISDSGKITPLRSRAGGAVQSGWSDRAPSQAAPGMSSRGPGRVSWAGSVVKGGRQGVASVGDSALSRRV